MSRTHRRFLRRSPSLGAVAAKPNAAAVATAGVEDTPDLFNEVSSLGAVAARSARGKVCWARGRWKTESSFGQRRRHALPDPDTHPKAFGFAQYLLNAAGKRRRGSIRFGEINYTMVDSEIAET